MKKITKLLAMLLVLVSVASCGASKKAKKAAVEGDTEIIIPCSGTEFTTDNKYFRANAMGISHSLEIASQKALTAARAKLAASIQTTVKTVTDNYISSYEDNASEEARSRYQSMIREVVNFQLNGTKVICQKTMKSTEGQYKCYVAIELSGEELAASFSDKVSKDSKLRTDFEYEKFKQEWEKEMSAYE